MSAAASKGAAATGGQRLQKLIAQFDASLANGKFPALMIVIVTGVMLYAFLLADDYRVASVTVEGLSHGDGADVVEQAGVLDHSVFHVRPSAAAARIAELPFVASATLEVQFPGRVTIKIVERPAAVNVEAAGAMMLVSPDAHVLAQGSVDGLPTLRVDNRGAALEETLDTDVIAAAGAIAGIYGPAVTLIWNTDIGLVLELPGGGLVNFGAPENIDAKLTVLAAIEDQLEEGWSQLDLSVPTRPSYR